MGMINVADGELPAIVTHLEMTARPKIADITSALKIVPWLQPGPDEYRDLFRKVGENWLWLTRLIMKEEKLVSIIHDPCVEIYRVQEVDRYIGLLELDFRQKNACEIGFFGLVPAANGKGHGRWLMSEALKLAWREGIKRVWLHTCTLDSPRALGFYQKSGFKAYKREIETFPDPRITGHLPPDAAPHIPIII